MASLAIDSVFMMGPSPRIQPTRMPGDMILDIEFSSSVCRAIPGNAAICGAVSPSKRSSPYGSSSTSGAPVRSRTSAISRRR